MQTAINPAVARLIALQLDEADAKLRDALAQTKIARQNLAELIEEAAASKPVPKRKARA